MGKANIVRQNTNEWDKETIEPLLLRLALGSGVGLETNTEIKEILAFYAETDFENLQPKRRQKKRKNNGLPIKKEIPIKRPFSTQI